MNLRAPFRSRGFTLMEIMIVVAIIGLVLTLGMPSFVRVLQKEGMRKGVDDLLEACRTARADAIIKGQPSELVFHPKEGDFSAAGFSSKFPDNVKIELLGVNFVEKQDADSANVKFFPNGTSDVFTIALRSDQGELRIISLDIVTALAEVEAIK